MKLNLDYLLETVWNNLALVRVYTKKRGGKWFSPGKLFASPATVKWSLLHCLSVGPLQNLSRQLLKNIWCNFTNLLEWLVPSLILQIVSIFQFNEFAELWPFNDFLLICFEEKDQLLWLLSSCKNFNVAHYSKSIKGIKPNLE